MSPKGKLVVAAVLFVALNYTVTAELLDLAPDAVDDMYTGCREKALEKFAHSDLLKEELGQNDFQAAWDASNDCPQLLPGGTKEHIIALLACFNVDPELLNTFNEAVLTKGTNVSTYKDHFPFKSFHFLLMDSIRLLHPKQECKTVYISPGIELTATKGSNVRFGEFVLAHKTFDPFAVGQVSLNITSCYFANLESISCIKEDRVILSPAEVFTVEEVEAKTDSNDAEYTEIVLKHSKLDSTHNCYIFSWSPVDVPPPKLLLVFLALSLYSLTE